MATKPLPPQEVLRQLLDYDPATGVLRWKARGPEWFAEGRLGAEKHAHWWNTRFAEKEALAAVNGRGYAGGAIFGARCRAHRVIWKLVTGTDPDEIDHINGCRVDNRLCNLRAVNRTENMQNKRRNSNNRSGVTGVLWHSASRKWAAKICSENTEIHLGLFDCIGQAIKARREAERRHGFHENHGRAA